MHERLLGTIAASCLLLAAPAHPQLKSGPQVVTFLSAIDDSDQPYGLYLPKTYTAAKKWPLVISLHGAGSNHRLNLRRVFGQGNRLGETDAEATRYFPQLKEVEFIVASPLARGTMGYQGIAEKDVYDVLADVKSRFAIDEERIYLTGLSMGGGGALWLGLTRPDIWAAVAAVCPAPPAGLEPLAGNALNIPVRLFQGALDPVVPVQSVRLWSKRLQDAGVRTEYTEYSAVRHNAWDPAYRNAAIFDWFAQHRRSSWPQVVQFTARDYEHRSAYWVRFDQLTPGTPAGFKGRVEAGNRVEITTNELGGFSLLLRGHPSVSPTQPLTVVVDGTTLKTKVQDVISFSRVAKGWALRKAAPPAGSKGPGMEGPISAAIGTRHLYVYGSQSAGEEEVRARREKATLAAEWSTPRLPLLLTFGVLADADVTAAERKSANLVLFGTKETNTVLAELAARLPLALNPGAADYGLLYVYPVDGRYVVINSGLPWWTRLDAANRPGLPFLSAPYRALMSFGDYILFRGGLDNVVVEGRFDTRWKLPAEAAQKMLSTGAVEVRKDSVAEVRP
ncbi:MAG TPA: alpha/beta fold hydrolase [Bryobacteraceae bacterium]|nr:alpha/beta fold hydrolase [Bryobacteraceae bacterium]